MSLSFQERFKNRANFVGRKGEIDLVCTTAISKPESNQLFPSPHPDLVSNPVPKNPISPLKKVPQQEPEIKISQARKQTHSAKPFRSQISTPSSNPTKNQNITHTEDFVPYTLKDYQVIKSEKYYQLGGLGPSNIGTDEWQARKELVERKMDFAKKVKIANANLPPTVSKKRNEVEREASKMEKAKIFAMGISKPKSRGINRENPATPSVLEELEKQHLEYKVCVDQIKLAYAD